MPLGRNNNKVKTPKLDVPPQVTQYTFDSPLGDRYLTQRKGAQEIASSNLSSATRSLLEGSQGALQDLLQDLRRPDAMRTSDIIQRGNDFYDLQANVINKEYDALSAKAKSDLSKRFGGTYNATFGTEYLGKLEQGRLSELTDSARQAALLAEDLFKQDEDSRMRRFSLFNNYLLDEHNKAQNFATYAGDLLQNESARRQDAVLRRTQMVQQAQQSNQHAALQRRQQTLNALASGVPPLLMMLA